MFFKKEKIILCSPVNGEVVTLSSVPDPVFAQEMLGKGFAVIPREGKVYSPINGKVVTVFETKHAIGLIDNTGVEVLVHIGIDTVKLNGEPFISCVKEGDEIKVGQLLSEFDVAKIESAGYEIITPIIVTNTADFKEIEVLKFGQAKVGDEIIRIKK